VKQIQIWPNHIRVPHLDLVLVRSPSQPLDESLTALARMGFDIRPENVEVHEDEPAS
jgi:hypothetical protein